MGIDPLTAKRAVWWEQRRRGLSLAEIGRGFGVTRQAVYLALGLADRRMVKTFRELASTCKVLSPRVNTERGLMVGYSQALDSKVLFVYTPGKGIGLWYKYDGQCSSCPKRDECLELIQEEATRLKVTIMPREQDLPPAKLAEIIFKRAWPGVME